MVEFAQLLDTAENAAALLLIAHSLVRLAEQVEAFEARPSATIHYLDTSGPGKPDPSPEER